MIRTVLICAALLGFSTSAAAQTYKIRSGEHDGFTRLVVDVPPNTQWDLRQNAQDRTAVLEIPAATQGYDDTNVFAKIDRARVAELTQGDSSGTLRIALGCDCKVQAYSLNNRMIVLDVAEQIAQVGEETKKTKDVAISIPNQQEDFSAIQIAGRPAIGPLKKESDLLPSVKLDRSEEVSALALELAGRLANGATRGILRPGDLEIEMAGSSQSKDGQTESQSGSGQPIIVDALSLLAGRDNVVISDNDCLTDVDLSVSKWLDERPIDEQISSARNALFDDLDRPVPQAFLEYAKVLLGLGFGAEARSILKDQNSAAANALKALSYAVDQENDPENYLKDKLHCNNEVAFWSLIASEDNSIRDGVERSAILRTVEQLPEHFQNDLSALAAQRLSNLGHQDIAKDLLNRVERMTSVEPKAIAQARAEIGLTQGDISEAKAQLEKARENELDMTPDIVALSVEIATQAEENISEDIVALSELYSEELEGTEDGSLLWSANVKALIANGQLEDALQKIRQPDDATEAQVRTVKNLFIKSVIDTSADEVFLKLSLDPAMNSLWPFRPDAGVLAAQRLMGLRLPEAALYVLKESKAERDNRDAQLVRASALIALDKPEEAELILIAMEGEDVARLRAKARERMGDHPYAQTVFSDLGQTEKSNEAAWLAGDWPALAQSDSSFSEVSALRLNEPAIADEDVTLAQAETLFSESTEARNTIRELLDATRISED